MHQQARLGLFVGSNDNICTINCWYDNSNINYRISGPEARERASHRYV